MKAMILAAGLGTRLQPLTNNKPKALIEIGGKPVLRIAIERLKKHGFNQIVINVHHFADMVADFLNRNANFNIDIQISDEREQLLETGGGLKKAAEFLQGNEPFLLYNADILTNLDLSAFYNYHIRQNKLATLSVQKRESGRVLLFNREKLLCGWKNKNTGEVKISRDIENSTEYAFNGIHVISPDIFPLMKESGAFSIIETYLRLAKTKEIMFYNDSDALFYDMGSVEKLKIAEENYKLLS